MNPLPYLPPKHHDHPTSPRNLPQHEQVGSLRLAEDGYPEDPDVWLFGHDVLEAEPPRHRGGFPHLDRARAEVDREAREAVGWTFLGYLTEDPGECWGGGFYVAATPHGTEVLVVGDGDGQPAFIIVEALPRRLRERLVSP